MKISELHDDDMPVGRILSRREVFSLFGAASATILLAACGDAATSTAGVAAGQPTQQAATPTVASKEGLTASVATTAATSSSAATTAAGSATTPSCVVVPEQTEGPYFVDEKLNRSDIRPDPSTGTAKAGVPLTLSLAVASVAGSGCTPLKGAQVDIWHCDALGVYSDTNDPGWNTVGQKFLRGYQVTDDKGAVQFTTIYPGWYQGRTIHIHFKIRTTGTNGQAYEFTSQFFFDDSLSDQVLTQAPYNTKTGTRGTRNANDGIYNNGGDQTLLKPTKTANGYSASFAIGLNLADTNVGKSDAAGAGGGMSGGPGGRPPGGPGGQPAATATPK